MATENLVKDIVQRNTDLMSKRSNFNNYFQVIAEHVLMRKANFIEEKSPGEPNNKNLYPDSGVKQNRKAASALLGLLWPNGPRSFEIEPEDIFDKDSPVIKEYFTKVNNRMFSAMDDANSGLTIALDEYMQDQLAFGTSGVGIFKGNDEIDIFYKPYSVEEIYIDEGSKGSIDTVYINFKWPLRKVINEYGLESLSDELKEKAEKGSLNDTVNILNAIEPNPDFIEDKSVDALIDNRKMPFRSIHLELDTKNVLRFDGFFEFPIKVARFAKTINEVYGRSRAMDALPDILQLQVMWNIITRSEHKRVSPPLGVLDDGRLGNGIIDGSPGAINVISPLPGGNQQNPIFPLVTIGSSQGLGDLIANLKTSIDEHFLIDTLLDFNDQGNRTLGEIQIRNNIRNTSLRAILSRQIVEVFDPLIKSTFNTLFSANKLGVISGSEEEQALIEKGEEPIIIPDEVAEAMAENKDIFKIKYITPAARLAKSESVDGVIRTWEMASSLVQITQDQSVTDILDPEESLKAIAEGTGAPPALFRDNEQVESIRESRNQQIQQQQQLETAQQLQSLAQNGEAA